jgi:hypothetical protein
MAKHKPEKLGEILARLVAQRGYARVSVDTNLADVWRSAAGDAMARYTRAGAIRRGTLEILVANSTLVQELGFQKQTLLEKLGRLLPDEKLKDLRFKVGRIDGT